MKFERVFWSKLTKLFKIHPTLTKSDRIWRHGTISENMLEMISSKLSISLENS